MKTLLFSLSILLGLSITAQNYHVNEDFNSGSLPSSWVNTAVTGSQAWSFGIDGSNGNSTPVSSGIQNIDGSPFAYFDDDVLTGSSINNFARLNTPSFDNSASLTTYLEFDFNYMDYPGIPDSFYVEVFDGLTWIKVLTRITNDCGHYSQPVFCGSGFPHANLDISSYKNSNCQVRFSYFDGNDWGWYAGIDNVQIYSPFPNDVQVTEIVGPASSCGLSSTESIQVKIKNIGTLAASNFTVSYQLNGGIAVNETVNGTIAPNDSLIYTFAATADLSAVSTHDIKAYTTLSGDGNLINDSTSATVINNQIFVPTYTNDFETANTNWKIEGTNSSWELGVPNNSNINIAASGQQAYVTNLDGIYNSNETSYLVSPCFDFTSSIGDPIITFSLQYLTEAAFDQLWMEYSLNGGQSWTKLAASANATNWYNNTTNQVWEGISNGWKSVENILTGLAGEPKLQLRLVFKSDGGGFDEGIGFDNFSIREPQAFDLALNQLVYPNSGDTNLCGYGSTENIIIEIENKGANSINNFDVSYQVGSGSIISETVTDPISPNSRYTYIFATQADFSAITSYNLRTWVSASNDSFSSNDTLNNLTIINTQNSAALSTPIFENFDSFTNGLGGGWTATGIGLNDFSWYPYTGQTTSSNTGPLGDHTTGNGFYVSPDASYGSLGEEPTLTSPCLDLSGTHAAKLTFWYHKHGIEMGDLFIDIYDGANWILAVDQIIGETQPNQSDVWIEKEINLSAYAGRKIKLRFRGTYNGGFHGDMAIDDISIYTYPDYDISLEQIVIPGDSNCTAQGTTNLAIELTNYSKASTPTDSVYLYYQIDNFLPVKDGLRISLNSLESDTFYFAEPFDFASKASPYKIRFWVDYASDTSHYNDTLSIEYFVSSLNSLETFGSGPTPIPMDWKASDQSNYAWTVKNNSGISASGPDFDHTNDGNQINGNWIQTEDSNTPPSQHSTLTSSCVLVDSAKGAVLSFWYYMFGANMGSLYIDIYDGTQWIMGYDQLAGEHQTSKNELWLQKSINLNSFTAKNIKIRFRAIYGSGYRSIIALDDIMLTETSERELIISNLISPKSTGCNLNTANVEVELSNIGLDSIVKDSVLLYYQIDGTTTVKDTLNYTIASGMVDTFSFSTPINLNNYGEKVDLSYWYHFVGTNTNSDTTFTYFNNFNHKPLFLETFESSDLGFCDFVSNNTELDNGWTTKDYDRVWNLQSNYCENVDYGSLYPRGTGKFISCTNGNYNRVEINPILESPCIDLSTSTNPYLSFWTHLQGFISNYNLKVSVNDGSGWSTNHTIQGSSQNTDEWFQSVVDLSAYQGKSIQIRFIDSIDIGPSNNTVSLDNIAVYNQSSVDISITDINSPFNESVCSYTSNTPLTVILHNVGLNSIPSNSINLEYWLNSSLIATESVNTSIPSGASILYAFNQTLGALNSGYNFLEIKAILNGDTLNFNNVIQKELYQEQIALPLYKQDFENFIASTNLNQENLRGWNRSPQTQYTWRVEKGSSANIYGPRPSTGASGDHTFASNRKNGTGQYLKINTGYDFKNFSNTSAILEIPCSAINLSSSSSNKVLLSFWYHMHGSYMGNLLVDVKVNSNWSNGVYTIIGSQQNSYVDGWKEVTLELDSFVSNNPIRLRFRGTFGISSVGSGEISLDDIEIKDRMSNDIYLKSLISLNSSCNLTNQENISVSISNHGTTQTSNINLSYQITHYDLKGVETSSPVFNESQNMSIPEMGDASFTFSNQADLSLPGEYRIKVWSNNPDSYLQNDSIIHFVQNQSVNYPYCEDFNSFPTGQTSSLHMNGYLNNGWKGSIQEHAFTVELNNESNSGNSNFGNKNLNYTSGFIQTGISSVTTPCIDLSTSNFPVLFYKIKGQNLNVKVEVNENGSNWTTIDNFQLNSNDWERKRAKLIGFKNSIVQLRISVVGLGYCKIDDVCIQEDYKQEVSFVELTSPNKFICSQNVNLPLAVKVYNDGSENIDSLFIKSHIDLSNVLSSPLHQTEKWYHFSPPISGNNEATVILDSNLALPNMPNYFIDVHLSLPNEVDKSDNSKSDIKLTQNNYLSSDTVSFEAISGEGRLSNYSNGFRSNSSNSSYYWTEKSGIDVPFITGPSSDNTLKNSNGSYMVTQSAANSIGDFALLESPCVNISYFQNPVLSYWYHMFGSQMGDLYVELLVNRNGFDKWISIDSIKGQQQSSNNQAYKRRLISLAVDSTPYTQIRFKSISGGLASNMAIDDIVFMDSLISVKLPNIQKSKLQLSLYPNPSTGKYFIKSSKSIAGYEYQILDLHGREVKRSKIKPQQNSFDLSDNAEGIYFLVIPEIQVKEKLVKL